MPEPENESPLRPEVRWGVGCLLGGASLLGVLVLMVVISFALSPPTWVQELLGVILVIGGVAFAWLVASALGQSRSQDRSGEIVGIDRSSSERRTGDRREGR